MDGAARAGRWLALESRLEACELVSGYVLGDDTDTEARGDERLCSKDFFSGLSRLRRYGAYTALETFVIRAGEGQTWERICG